MRAFCFKGVLLGGLVQPGGLWVPLGVEGVLAYAESGFKRLRNLSEGNVRGFGFQNYGSFGRLRFGGVRTSS